MSAWHAARLRTAKRRLSALEKRVLRMQAQQIRREVAARNVAGTLGQAYLASSPGNPVPFTFEDLDALTREMNFVRGLGGM